MRCLECGSQAVTERPERTENRAAATSFAAGTLLGARLISAYKPQRTLEALFAAKWQQPGSAM